MSNYHLYPGDMFRTNNGLGLIVKKSGGYFTYSTVASDQRKICQTIEIKRFYGYCDDMSHGHAVVLEVMLVPNRKYRRKRK